MDRDSRMVRHLANAMGLKNLITAPEQYQVGERVTHEVTDIRREIFNPFVIHSQWVAVILWAVDSKISITLDMFHADATAYSGEYAPASHITDCERSTRMAATLEAIAFATGWQG